MFWQPTALQALVPTRNACLRLLLNHYFSTYVDDLIIISKKFIDYRRHVQLARQRLIEHSWQVDRQVEMQV